MYMYEILKNIIQELGSSIYYLPLLRYIKLFRIYLHFPLSGGVIDTHKHIHLKFKKLEKYDSVPKVCT